MALGRLDIIMAADMAQLRRDMSTATGILKSSSAEMSQYAKQATSSIQNSFSLLKGAIAGGIFAEVTKEAIKMADTFKLIEGRLSLVTNGYQQLTSAQQSLFAISQNTRQSLESTTDLYSRIARSTKELGKSQSEMLTVTEAINKSFIISGSSAQSANAAIIQLGQGFASGRLNGDELRSVLENAPRLAEAIAKGMKVTVGQLREMGAEGKLTSEEVFKAIQSQSKALSDEFSKMPMTVGQSILTVKNSLLSLVGEFDKVTGASSAVSDSVREASKWMDENSSEIVKNIVGLKEYSSTVIAIGEAYLVYKASIAATTLAQSAYSSVQAQASKIIASQTAITTAATEAERLGTIAVQTRTLADVAKREAQLSGLAVLERHSIMLEKEAISAEKAAKSATAHSYELQAMASKSGIAATAISGLSTAFKTFAPTAILFGITEIFINWDKITGNIKTNLVSASEQLEKMTNNQLLAQLDGYVNKIKETNEEIQKLSPKSKGFSYFGTLSEEEKTAAKARIDTLKQQKEEYQGVIDKIIELRKQKNFKEEATEEVKELKDRFTRSTEPTEEQLKYLFDLQKSAYDKETELAKKHAEEMQKFNDEQFALLAQNSEKSFKQLDAVKDWAKEEEESAKNAINAIKSMQDAMITYYEAIGDTQSAYYAKEAKLVDELKEKKLLTDAQINEITAKNKEKFLKEQFEENNKWLMDLFDNVEKAMDESFFDVTKGKFKSFGDWLKDFFESIGDSILRGLSRTLAGDLTNSIKKSLMGSSSGGSLNIGSLLGLAGTSIVGSTVSAAEIGSLMNSGATFDSATNTIKTAGGTVLNLLGDGSGKVSSGGTDAMSLVSNLSSLKSVYDLATNGISSSVLGGFTSLSEMTGISSIGEFGVGFASPFASTASSGNALAGLYGSGIGEASTATSVGAGASAGLMGAGLGYGIGSLGDSLFGAKTKASSLGAIGGTIGSFFGPIGMVVGAVIGSLVGGAFGSTKVKDTGLQALYDITGDESKYDYNAVSEGRTPLVGTEWIQGYQNKEYKSWFDKDNWTENALIPDAQRKAIEQVFDTYDVLLNRLGVAESTSIKAGQYTGETLLNAIDKSFIELFTGIPQQVEQITYYQLEKVNNYSDGIYDEFEKKILAVGSATDDFTNFLSGVAYETSREVVSNAKFDAIYQQWVDYAESIDKTVTQALTESIGSMISAQREFEIWLSGSGSLEALSLQAKFAQQDFEDLANSLGITGVTVENYMEQYANAVKNSLDPTTINNWNALGSALRSSTDAQTAYTNALFAQANSIRQMAYDLNSTMLQIQGQSNSAIATQLAFDNLIASAKKEGIDTADWERYTASQFASSILANPTYLNTMSNWLADRISSGKEGSLTASALNALAQQAYNANKTIQQTYENTTYQAVNNIETVGNSFLAMLEDVNSYIVSLTNRILGVTAASSSLGYTQAKLAFASGVIDFNAFQGYADDYLSSSKEASTSKLEYLRAIASVRNDMLLISGSHANGLDYVPYDGYIAELHKGEKVQTASEVQKDAIIVELKDEIKNLKELTFKTAEETTRMSSLLNRLSPDGDALQVRITA